MYIMFAIIKHVMQRLVKPGVYNVEEFDPDPFMEALNKFGLPWVEDFNPNLID